MPGGEPRFGELSLTGYEQTWLPPLAVRESASSKLVKSLKELDSSVRLFSPSHAQNQASTTTSASTSASTPSSARGLRTISRFGMRANERAAEAESDLGLHESEDRLEGAFDGVASYPSNAHGAHSHRDPPCNKAFERLVESISAALSLGDAGAPVRALRRDEAVTEHLPLRGVRHYKIALPSRPTAVTVTLTRSSGVSPILWGSTGCERPTARNHDLRGSHDRLVYEHVLGLADDGEDAGGLDRRKSVPPHRELYVTVEAEAGECAFKLQVTFGQVKIVLSRAEISMQVQKIRRGWEARVATLQTEPSQREQFEEHVKNITAEKHRRKQECHRNVDFLSMNMKQLSQASPHESLLRVQKRALLGFERQDEASARRTILQEEADKAKHQWLRRSEDRKNERLREQERLELAQRTEDTRRSWMIRLAVISFAEHFGRKFAKAKDEDDYTRRIIVSACILQRFLIKALCKTRRLALYRNLVKLRMGLASYTRTMRPAVMCASEPVVKGFLTEYAFSKEAPNLIGALKRFRATVVMIQRWWHQRRRTRQAYVKVFLPYWEEAETKVWREIAMEIAVQEKVSSHPDFMSRRSSFPHSNALGGRLKDETVRRPSRQPPASGAHGGHKGAATPATSAMDQEEKALRERAQTIEQYLDFLPQTLVRTVLTRHIGEMMRSYKMRMKMWEEGKREFQWHQDLEAFGVHEEGSAGNAFHRASMLLQRRPRSVYLDQKELEELVQKHVDMWRKGNKGAYKDLHHYRRQVFGHFFSKWHRQAHHPVKENAKVRRLRSKMNTFFTTSSVFEDETEDGEEKEGGPEEAPAPSEEESEAEAEAHEEIA